MDNYEQALVKLANFAIDLNKDNMEILDERKSITYSLVFRAGNPTVDTIEWLYRTMKAWPMYDFYHMIIEPLPISISITLYYKERGRC